jgi:hypothetical protein
MHELPLAEISQTMHAFNGKAFYVWDAKLAFSGYNFICSACGENSKTARAKMISEAAERAAFLDVLRIQQNTFAGGALTSTGFAAHETREEACEAASLELIERSVTDLLRYSPGLKAKSTVASDCTRTWIYSVPERELHYAISRYEGNLTTGWGSSVHRDEDRAIAASRTEACMMAMSLTDFGWRGNAVSYLAGGRFNIGQQIYFEDYGIWRVLGEIRHAVRAVWQPNA